MLALCFGLSDSGVRAPAPRYCHALERAGIAYTNVNCEHVLNARALAEDLEGLFLCGGDDVDPLLYGKARRAPLAMVTRMREQNEIALCRAFYARKKPIFGICRGIQILNVALGGSLFTHIENHRAKPHPVQFFPQEDAQSAYYPAAFVDSYQEGSLVNTFHHQSVDRLAEPLCQLAAAPDGTAEACYGKDAPIFAVQWHPEMTHTDTALGEEFFAQVARICQQAAR